MYRTGVIASPKALLVAAAVALPLVAMARPAYSQDATAPTEAAAAPAEATPAEAAAEEKSSYPSRSLKGWVDSSVVWSNDDLGQNGKVGFQMAQVGLRMSHDINENYGGFVQINGFSSFAGDNALVVRAREAYGFYQTDGGKFKVLAGKFYAPIGFELADPPDLYQFSNSLVFANMIPTELVGIMGVAQLTDTIDVKLYTSGPWDNDQAALQFGDKNIGTRVGFSLGDLGGFGVSAIGGPQGTPGLHRAAIDVDASLTPAEGLLIGAEVNANMYGQFYGNVVTDAVSGDIVGGDKKGYAMPIGFLVMTNYTFTDWFNLTLRYDMVKDAAVGKNIAKEVPGAPLFGLDAKGKEITLSSVTVGPNFHLTDGWDVFTEVRYDMASSEVFLVDGTAEKGLLSTAAELIYQF